MTNKYTNRIKEWQYEALGGVMKYISLALGVGVAMKEPDFQPLIACGIGVAIGEAMQKLPYVWKQEQAKNTEREHSSYLESEVKTRGEKK